DLVLLSDDLGLLAHMHALEGAPEAVMHHRVDHLGVAHTIAGARLGQQVRRIAHAFHAAGDVEVPVAGLDRLRGEHYRLEAGAADLVDGDGGDIRWDATMQRRLARRSLALARGDDVAHDDLVDVGDIDACALDRLTDSDGAKLRG